MFLIVSSNSCQLQSNSTKMKENQSNKNPLLCEPQSGICEIPSDKVNKTKAVSKKENNRQLKILYFTDPICSSCWGIEPQLRKLKLEYGEEIEIEYRMGGLLPDWSYNSGGISKPSDVAHHWDEVSIHYDMPIDGDVWLEDPLDSSYPPSIAYKAAQMQNQYKADLFLREIREMVFLKKLNITKWEHLETAAKISGLNVKEFKSDYENKAKEEFYQDLAIAKQYGVRGFPTIFFLGDNGHQQMVYGSKPYVHYENAMQNIQTNISKNNYAKNWEFLFTKFKSYTAKEFSELSGKNRNEVEGFLDDLVQKGKLEKLSTKNGALWTLKASN